MSDGHCDVDFSDYSDGESCEFYQATEHTARKAHKCSECREPIKIGDRYERVAYKFEGDFNADRYCLGCKAIFEEFHAPVGEMEASFREEWSHGATLQGCLNRLASAAGKARLTAIWRKWKGLDQSALPQGSRSSAAEHGRKS